jgi:hypothetical protein
MIKRIIVYARNGDSQRDHWRGDRKEFISAFRSIDFFEK